jgi:alpha-beta hydrolase superfamily lysophospholipase
MQIHLPIDNHGASVSFEEVLGERIVTVSPKTGSPRANLLFVHGLGDHPARHLATARWLAARGYRTFLFDLVAHGSQAHAWDRSRWVYEAYASSGATAELIGTFREAHRTRAPEMRALATAQYARLARTHVDDHLAQVTKLIRYVQWVDGRTPLFLGGHSMGALLAVEAAWRLRRTGRNRQSIAGVLMIAPALRPQGNADSALSQLVVDGVWTLRRAPVSLVRSVFKIALDLNLSVDTSWGSKWLSDLPEEVQLFTADPLVPHRLPTRYASSIESLMVSTRRRGERFPFEGLMVVPARDGITSREAGIRFAERANAGSAKPRVRLVRLGVTAHDVLRSSARSTARTAIGDWLDARVAGWAGAGARSGEVAC